MPANVIVSPGGGIAGPFWADKVLTHRVAYPALTVIVLTLGLGPAFLAQLNDDVSWFLYAAERVGGGATLYVDVVETNPPLIVWLGILPVLLARALGVSDIVTLRILVVLIISGSLALSGWVLRCILSGREIVQRGLILLLLFLLLPFVGYQFGQREHLMLALILPYLLTASARAMGRTLDGRVSLLLGGMAGVGIALKPYFVPLWLVVEGYLAWARRGPRIWLRPETVGVVAVGIVYAGAVLAFAPDYLKLAMTMKPIYAGYCNRPIAMLLTNPVTLLSASVLFGFLIVRPRGDVRELCRVFLLANGCLLGAALYQQKGWANHYYPANAISLFILGLFVVETRRRPGLISRLIRDVTGGFLIFYLISGSEYSTTVLLDLQKFAAKDKTRNARLVRLVDEHAKGRSIYLMSDRLGDAFPLVINTGARWASRFPSLWMLPGIYPGEPGSVETVRFHPIQAMGDMERFQFEAVISDLLRDPPELLIVDAWPDKPSFGARRFDYLEYFCRDRRFGTLFQNYESLTYVDKFHVYRRLPSRPRPISLLPIKLQLR